MLTIKMCNGHTCIQTIKILINAAKNITHCLYMLANALTNVTCICIIGRLYHFFIFLCSEVCKVINVKKRCF